MQRLLGMRWLALVLLAALLALPACNKTTDSAAPNPGPGGPRFGPGGPGGPPTPIGEIMMKLTKGPQSLTQVIGRELNEDSPPWDTIQPQAQEYVRLAQSMSKYDPPKGSKESWQKQTDAYTRLAEQLNKAAQDKDKNKALDAHKEITQSCKGCHDEHRLARPGPGMGPPGRPGGPPPGGPPRGGQTQ